MVEPQFTEYAIKLSKSARDTRQSLPPEVWRILDTIEANLSEDPRQYANHIIPASIDGSSSIYIHPNPRLEISFQVDEEHKIIYFFHYSAPSFAIQKTIFVSYSHNDRAWLNKLRNFLTVLEQQGVIKFWDDSQIEPGVKWEDEIRKALDSSRAGLLLVSQEFLASKFITETELPKLLNNAVTAGKRIFWLQLSPSTVFDTHREITQFQSLLDDPKVSLQELETVNEAQLRKVLVEMSRRLSEAVA
jgi:hypothetical protein